jgi:hypothetical protein
MEKTLITVVGCLCAPSLFAANLTFETKTLSETNQTAKYVISIHYPQIKSPHKDSQKRFNRMTKDWAMSQANLFKKSVQNCHTMTNVTKAHSSSFEVTYDLYTIPSNKVISLRYSLNRFLAGAAHGSHIYSAFNYDLIGNRVLSLSDLFKASSAYLDQIAAIASKKVPEQLTKAAHGHVEVYQEGLAPTAKNYAVWNLTPHGLTFTFNEYQVAAYVYGPQQITIPYSRLYPFYAPGSPVTEFLITHANKAR